MHKINIRDGKFDDIPDVARIHVTAWQESYQGVVPQEYLDELNIEERRENWEDGFEKYPDMQRFILEVDGEVVGWSCCGPQREEDVDADGEFYAIYLLDKAKGLGGGKQLMQVMADKLMETGHNAASVWVLADNPRARKFYESLGAKLTGHAKTITIKGKDLEEVCYVWDDLKASFVNPQPGPASIPAKKGPA